MSTQLRNPFPPDIRRLGIITPAGIPDQEKMEHGLALLRSWGLDVISPRAFQGVRFLAGTDTERADHMNSLLADQSIDMILAARGGHGCTRILDLIDWDLLLRRDLPIVGYSDITALHMKAFAVGARTCIAGPMLTGAFCQLHDSTPQNGDAQASIVSFAELLGSRNGSPAFIAHSCTRLNEGIVSGPLVPANLAVLSALLGTPHFPDLNGAILVLEDINEAAFRIDRYLNQLRQCGVLRELGGLVFGQFTDCEDEEFLPAVFAEHATHVKGPVAGNLPFGHETRSLSLPVGTQATLSVGPGTSCLVVTRTLP